MLKLDLHCHTREGSIDSKIGIVDYAHTLKKQGFDGMMVTDHDSYKGYMHWQTFAAPLKEPETTLHSHHFSLNTVLHHWVKDFVVLKGIEYDTKDAGHFLVIMPDDVHLKVLQVRGMTVKKLIKLVHQNGGILGPAHPFGVRSSSAMFFKKIKEMPEMIKDFDFLEGFNTCESEESNRLAKEMGISHNLPMIGGSDSHSHKNVGQGYTVFSEEIRCNNDLINAIKSNAIESFGGVERGRTYKCVLKTSKPLIAAFKMYNGFLGFLFSPYRHLIARKASLKST